MALPLSFLTPGRAVRVRCDGEELAGQVVATTSAWLRLATADGDVLVNLASIAWIRGEGAGVADQDEDALPQPSAKELVARPGSKAPGRPWSDATVQAVVEGFLNDRNDGELAAEHGRTRHQITILHQAWECARGNLADDQLSPAARLWVDKIRRVMRPG